jgi:glycosyltransferase involved in cell wall biosynthesis
MALLEAMAGGLAPVTTTVGSMGEAVRDRLTGLVVQPGSFAQIAAALNELVSDEDLRARLGTAARGRSTDFGLERWYQRLVCLWTDLVNERPAPRR